MEDCVKRVGELERLFSDNQYYGRGKDTFFIEEGIVPVMVSAPHAVKQFRDGKIKKADVYTGGIARYLHEVTGCHLICSGRYTENDPNYDQPGSNAYQDALLEYLNGRRIAALLDLHGVVKEREYAIELGTVPTLSEEDTSLHEYKFIADLLIGIFESSFKECSCEKKSVWKNKIFSAGNQNTVTKFISENTDTVCVQLEINRIYREPENRKEFAALIRSLREVIGFLAAYDWK